MGGREGGSNRRSNGHPNFLWRINMAIKAEYRRYDSQLFIYYVTIFLDNIVVLNQGQHFAVF